MPAPWANGAQARIVGRLHGQDTVNVLNFATNTNELDVSPPSPLLTALVQAILECVIDTLLPAVTLNWEARFVDARFTYRQGTPFPTDPVVATAPSGSVGSRGETSVSFAASLIQVRSGLGGRRGRGRIFLPPPGEGDISQSAIDSTTQDLLIAFLTCMAGKFLGTSPSTEWRLGVLSRTIAGGNNANFDAGFFVASQLTPTATLAHIGRRKVGRGS